MMKQIKDGLKIEEIKASEFKDYDQPVKEDLSRRETFYHEGRSPSKSTKKKPLM